MTPSFEDGSAIDGNDSERGVTALLVRSSPDASSDPGHAPLALVAATAAVGAVGLGAGGTAGALLGAEIGGSDATAGLPLGLLVLGSGVSALLIARLGDAIGRRASLAAGYVVGALGALVVIGAAAAGDFSALLAGSALMGGANAAVMFTRYAAAEVAAERARGRAVGVVLFATALGAVGSPLLLAPSGRIAAAAGLPRLTGLYLTACVAFCSAAIILAVASGLSAAALEADGARGMSRPTLREVREGVRTARASLAIAALAVSNFTMVAFMAVGPLQMIEQGSDLAAVGGVVALHVGGMFGLSPLSGWLADRAGAAQLAAAGCALQILIGAGGAFADRGSELTVVLVLAGVAWNFSVVGGSTILASSVSTGLRAHVEGLGEAAMAFAAAVAAPVAGALMAAASFSAVSILSASVVLCVMAMAVAAAEREPTRSPPNLPRARKGAVSHDARREAVPARVGRPDRS